MLRHDLRVMSEWRTLVHMTLVTVENEHAIDVSGEAQLGTRRLIDEGLSSIETSSSGARERYARGTTSHTAHVWWARRPHTAMRSLVFACLAAGGDARARQLLVRLGAKPHVEIEVLTAARRCLREQYGRAPRVLDIFGGGGTIPYEAVNLGADTWASDINPLSVFIQRCLMVYPLGVSGVDLGALVAESGDRVLTRLSRQTAPLFPLRNGNASPPPVAYLWTYARHCEHCGYRFFLMKRPWLSRRSGRRMVLRAVDGPCAQSLRIEEQSGDGPINHRSVWQGRSGPVICARCQRQQGRPDALQCEDWLAAVVSRVPRAGKRYQPGGQAALPATEFLEQREQALLSALCWKLPESHLPHWSGVVNPPLYGIRRHADIFNPRQRVVMLTLLEALAREQQQLLSDHGVSTTKAVIGMLSALLDQLVDWNCRLSMWISQNEQIGRAFCGPGVAMLWDYAEMDPCMDGPANLRGKLERIVRACEGVQRLPGAARVSRADAAHLEHADDFFDTVISDPPYYDNLPYAALADCFYAWKRPLLKTLEPDLFAASSTAADSELTASSRRCSAGDDGHARYCRQLRAAVAEAARVLAPHGVCALVYSHGTMQAWLAVIQAFRATRLQVSDVLPLAIERRKRPRAMSARAVNACVVIVARKRRRPLRASASTVLTRFGALTRGEFLVELLDAGWDRDQAALALYAKGVGMLAAAHGDESTDRDQLLAMEDIVRRRCPLFRMLSRRPI